MLPSQAKNEISLDAGQFDAFRAMLKKACGITLQDGKEGLVVSRVQRRILKLGLDGFTEYLDVLRKDPAEVVEMVDVLTTNKTSFFREPKHFDFLRKELLPYWLKQSPKLRIWCAGCSSGQEPYSLSVMMHEQLKSLSKRDIRILATDISHTILAEARQGSYKAHALSGLSKAQLARYFIPEANGGYRVKPEMAQPITFARLNLMGTWQMQGPFQAIFCRNVMIYFDEPTRKHLVARYRQLLAPNGYLFIGHSESLGQEPEGYRLVQPAVYQKQGNS